MGVVSATAAILVTFRNTLKRCDQPLGMWNTIHATILGMGLLCRFWVLANTTYFPRREGEG